MKLSLYLRSTLTLVVLDALFWFGSRPERYRVFVLTLFAISASSIFLILLRTRRSGRELVAVLALSLSIFGIDIRFLGYPACWQGAVSVIGLASLGVLTLRVIWSDGNQRRLAAFTAVPAFSFVASGWCAATFLHWTFRAHPSVLDLYLVSFDGSLHVQLPFLLGQLFARFWPFYIVSLVVYIGLPVALGLTYAGCLMNDRKNALPAFIAFLITGPIGILFYNLFPALGPAYIYADRFPWHPLAYDQLRRLFVEPVALPGLRNAMPSLHAAWAYLVFWYARGLSVLERVVAAVVLVFTVFATMGTGEHYFIDLVVAVPYALFILALTNSLVHRGARTSLTPLLVGLGITLAWFVSLRLFLRFFWLTPILPWGTCVLTLILSAWAGRWLLIRPNQVAPYPSPFADLPQRVVE